MNYKAIIFDLDGTLLDTLKDLALSANTVLERRGYRGHSEDKYRYFVGEGIEVLVKKALPPEAAEHENLGEIVQEVKNEYGRRWADHTAPYPGIPELLDNLEEKGLPKAILSNKPHEFTIITVEALLPRWYFHAVQGISELPRKPDPAGAFRIADKLGLAPSEILYVGDTATDMKTAVAAGMYPVGVLWGFRTAQELLENGAQTLISHPEELLAQGWF